MRIPDWVWPGLSDPELSEDPAETSPSEKDISVPDAALLASVERRLAAFDREEQERDRDVEAKLIPFLSITSLIAAVLAAALPLALVGRWDTLETKLLVPILILGLYTWVHAVLCAYEALNGLKRRAYFRLGVTTLDPRDGEDDIAYRNRLVNEQRNALVSNTETTNSKVDAFILARLALRNAILGAATMGLFVAGTGLWEAGSP